MAASLKKIHVAKIAVVSVAQESESLEHSIP